MVKFSFCMFWTLFIIYQGLLTAASHDVHDESGEMETPPFHSPGPYPNSDDNDDMNEHEGESGKLKKCEYLAPYKGVMFCAHGCCGSLEDQKCCEKDNDQKVGLTLNHIILLVVVAVLLIIIFALIGLCLYKHKKSLYKRRTSPVSFSSPALSSKAALPDIFYTKNSRNSTDEKEKSNFVDIRNERQEPVWPTTPPPRYSEKVTYQSEPEVQQQEMQPYLDQPPPYFVAVASVAPSSTGL